MAIISKEDCSELGRQHRKTRTGTVPIPGVIFPDRARRSPPLRRIFTLQFLPIFLGAICSHQKQEIGIM